eukprot:974523-Pleurochrysis_carterae.AAC.1
MFSSAAFLHRLPFSAIGCPSPVKVGRLIAVQNRTAGSLICRYAVRLGRPFIYGPTTQKARGGRGGEG